MGTPSDGSLEPTLTPSQASDPGSGDTLVATAGDDPPRARASRLSLPGYDVGDRLGEGGMGEVLVARDARIGRTIAIKRMRGTGHAADAVERFLREAKIQARLDHPAIVPVHELGEDAEGRPYFTMKRLAGKTLQEVLAAGGQPRQRHLRVFGDVCKAVAFAHARGVVHRDLKPSNIMIGAYGEVYVLDWGVARVLGERADGAGAPGDISTLEGHTQAGALLGTPGYMAPEQVRGEEVGTPADVYALGCVLFELLAGEPLHPRGHAAIATTLAGTEEGPAQRRRDGTVPPELDEVCRAALASDPAARPGADELAARIERYLDGDRDLERRRALAAAELAAAREAARDPARRPEAIRAAGRALVLDPSSSDATALVIEMLIEPPADVPPVVERELADHDAALASRASLNAAGAMLGYLAFIPLMLWMGVKSWSLFALLYGSVGALMAHALYQARTRRVTPMVPLAVNVAQMVVLSRFSSPLVIAPALVCTYVATLTTQSGAWKRPLSVIVLGLLAVCAPFALEAAGVLQRTWWLDHGRLVIHPTAVALGGSATIAMLVLANAGLVVVNAVFSRAMAASRDHAHRQLELQAWQLRQLLPVETPRAELAAIQGCAPAR